MTEWERLLAGWAIPPAILDAAKESPWGFEVAMFARRAAEPDRDSPSAVRAREAVPDGGSVLDVGCGAGAAAFALVPPAAHVTGVDESVGMLEAFHARAGQLGVDADVVEGRWPDAAQRAPIADVVVCWHVLHNVGDLAPFAQALDAHARRRVVIEMGATHPLAWLTPYWRRFHRLDRPDGPTDAHAIAALRDVGIEVDTASWDASVSLASADLDAAAAFVRRRLCLPAARDAEVRAALAELGVPATRRVTALWWTPSSAATRRK
jgi:SAM-dependent methyltransferase